MFALNQLFSLKSNSFGEVLGRGTAPGYPFRFSKRLNDYETSQTPMTDNELRDYTETNILKKFQHPKSCSFCEAGFEIIKRTAFTPPPLEINIIFVLRKIKSSLMGLV